MRPSASSRANESQFQKRSLVLNPMATWLWELLGVSRTTGDLVAEIRGRFPTVTEERAGADLAVLLDELLQHEVVAREA